jgi:hypothetical protein
VWRTVPSETGAASSDSIDNVLCPTLTYLRISVFNFGGKMDKIKKEQGKVLIQSVLLCAVGLLFIALGLSFLPIVGIAVGAAFLWFGLYPWIKVLHRHRANVLIGSVSDNYLQDRRIPVAILSATKERDGFDFNPGLVDPSSVRIGPGKIGPVDDMSDPMIYERSLRDINKDGIPDLILYFSADSAGINEKVEEVCVRAKMKGGGRVVGCNTIDLGYESELMKSLEYV